MNETIETGTAVCDAAIDYVRHYIRSGNKGGDVGAMRYEYCIMLLTAFVEGPSTFPADIAALIEKHAYE